MKFYVRDNEIEVVLSERNVRTLHRKIGMPDSGRELQKEDAGYLLRVRVELDEGHYADRAPGPVVFW